ncbi:hypothetical protein [Paenibacillus sp. FSL L8-0709]|uniref:hypothetical protein n=1 Tax=Paenibacillus sp. FSL L8-0709 TaxID=2975312 RepID=UPI0030FA1AC7
MTPYDEINQLIKKTEEAKETLEGTDTEYFSEEQLKLLNKTSNELVKASFEILSSFNKD